MAKSVEIRSTIKIAKKYMMEGYRMKRISTFFLVLSLVCCMILASPINVSATSVGELDGLEVSVQTDKETYAEDEEILLSVSIKNTNSFDVEGISVENVIPDGLVVKSGNSRFEKISIQSGETYETSIVTLEKKKEEITSEETTQEETTIEETTQQETTQQETTQDEIKAEPVTTGNPSVTDNKNTAESPKTGDSTKVILWAVLLVISGVAIGLVFKNRKRAAKVLSVFLCVVMVSSILPIGVSAEDNNTTSITLDKKIVIGDEEYTIKTIIKFYGPEINESETNYVTFMLNDGSSGAYEMQVVALNARATEPESPESDYYEFLGWYTEPAAINLYNFAQPVTSDIVLYAKWGSTDGDGDLYAASSGGGTQFSISGLEVEESILIASVNVNNASALVVRFLDENTKSEITTISAQTPDYGELLRISIPIDVELPDTYIITADLYDSESNKLCDTFTSIKYTTKYKEFSKLTVNDFGEDKTIVNFDETTDNNFGVLNDDVIIISQNDETNGLSVVEPEMFSFVESDEELDEEADVYYYFFQANEEIASLQKGDVVFAEDINGQYRLFKVGEITEIEEDEYLVQPSKDVELTDFYDTLKVDMDVDTAENNAENDIIEKNMSVSNYANIIGVNNEFSAQLGGEIEANGIKFSLSGKGTVSIEMTYNAHFFGEDYFYCSIITAIESKVQVSADVAGIDNKKKVEKELELAKVYIPTAIPGLTIYIAQTIPVEVELKAEVIVSVTSKTKSGFIYDSYSGKQSVDEKTRTSSAELKGSAEAKFGPKFETGVSFCGEVVKANVSVQAGAKLSAEASIGGTSTNEESKHACSLCLEGKSEWFAEGKVKLEICIIEDVLEGTPLDLTIFEVSGPLYFGGLVPVSGVGTIGSKEAKFYLSLINDSDSMFGGNRHFGGGSCPNKSWRTTVRINNNNNQNVNGVNVKIKKGNNIVSTGGSTHTAYLTDGVYNVNASIDGVEVNKNIVVNGAAQEIVLRPDSADGELKGKVCASDTNAPISNANIIISQGEMIIGTLKSDANGNYSKKLPDGVYRVEITYEGYIPFVTYVTIENANINYLETALMVYGNKQKMGGFSGTITDAVSGAAVAGVTLKLREGWNNSQYGNVIRTLTTDNNGLFKYDINNVFGIIFGLQSGNYTLTASKEGYATTSFNVVVLPGVVTANQNATISSMGAQGEYRIVLRWGNRPSDLDSHLVANTVDNFKEHIYFSDKRGYAGNLDRDDTNYEGPETITVTDFELLKNGFVYCVHDYSNRKSDGSNVLSLSNATVYLYKGKVCLKTYHVPTDNIGTVWNVFKIDSNGNIIDINTFDNIMIPEDVGSTFVQ